MFLLIFIKKEDKKRGLGLANWMTKTKKAFTAQNPVLLVAKENMNPSSIYIIFQLWYQNHSYTKKDSFTFLYHKRFIHLLILDRYISDSYIKASTIFINSFILYTLFSDMVRTFSSFLSVYLFILYKFSMFFYAPFY